MRFAVIDVGTNTAQLLIADMGSDGCLVPILDERRFVRLGEGVDATRRLREVAYKRLRAVLQEYCALIQDRRVEHVTIAGTSASRDLRNREDLVAWVRRETGFSYDILSGEDEATWSFRGALTATDNLSGPCIAVDIGGGSTEFAMGDASGLISGRVSIDVGSLRITERFLGAQPPRPEQIAEAEGFLARMLESVEVDRRAPLLSACDTPVILLLLHTSAASWDALAPAMCRLSYGDVDRWCERLLAMAYEDVLALRPPLLAGRADVFPAAVLIFRAVLRELACTDCLVSPHGLRHGLVLRAARALQI